jgi:hypothetical protein
VYVAVASWCGGTREAVSFPALLPYASSSSAPNPRRNKPKLTSSSLITSPSLPKHFLNSCGLITPRPFGSNEANASSRSGSASRRESCSACSVAHRGQLGREGQGGEREMSDGPSWLRTLVVVVRESAGSHGERRARGGERTREIDPPIICLQERWISGRRLGREEGLDLLGVGRLACTASSQFGARAEGASPMRRAAATHRATRG